MCAFRKKSIKNDKTLKALYEGDDIIQITKAVATTNKPTLRVSKNPRPNVHFSVKEIILKYPKYILPYECLNWHLGAHITLLTNEIDKYLEEHNLTNEDIGKFEKPKTTQLRKRKHLFREEENTVGTSKKTKFFNKLNDNLKTGKNREVQNINRLTEVAQGQISAQKICGLKDVQIQKRKSRSHLEKLNACKEFFASDFRQQTNKEAKTMNKSFSTVRGKKNESIIALAAKKTDDFSKNSSKSKNGQTPASLNMLLFVPHSPFNRSTSYSESSFHATDNTPIEIIDESVPPFRKSSIQSLLKYFTSEPFFVEKPVDRNDDDVVIVDMICDTTSQHSCNSSTGSNEVSKSTYSEDVGTNNQPDLSLVSVAKKANTLYTCHVCYSQHVSLYALKKHELKTHTTCPFCNKKFRSIANREKHILKWCPVKKNDEFGVKKDVGS